MLLPQLINSGMMNQPNTSANTSMPPGVLLVFTIFGSVICFCAVVAGTLSIIGGVFGLKKKRWAVALAGAISSAVLFFPIGIIATVLISLGRSEFSSSQASDSITEMSHNITSDPAEAN
jgi:hypothetical protein